MVNFVGHSKKMKFIFWKQGYPDKIIEIEMKSVNFGEIRSKTECATGLPFVVKYHPRLKVRGTVIHENLNLLYMKDKVKDTFTPRPMISSRTAQKLSSYLLRAKLYQVRKTCRFYECNKKPSDF